MATPAGRARAWRELIWGDHGFLRYLYDNTHAISPQMRRSFQPAPFHLRKFAREGVKTIINLRGESPKGYFRLEQEHCEKLGLRLENFRAYSRDVPSKEFLHGARDLFQRIEYPAVMHCKSGSDRVGLMSSLYLFIHVGLPLDEAQKQLSLRYGHIKQGKTGILDFFFDQYRAYNAERPTPFFEWVDTIYDPAAVKSEFMGDWWANILTDRILRRE